MPLLIAAALTAMVGVQVGGPSVRLRDVASSTYNIWPSVISPPPSVHEGRSVTLGVVFTTATTGDISAIRYYSPGNDTGAHTATLWKADGTSLATATLTASSAAGWQKMQLAQPVRISSGTRYVASYSSPRGNYVAKTHDLSGASPVASRDLTASAGVFTYAAGVPNESWQDSNYFVDVDFTPSSGSAPPPTPPSPSTFPNSLNTGPSGSLSSYSGPLTINTATTIASKNITGTLVVRAPLTITNSVLKGTISSDIGQPVTITDSEIDGGVSQAPAVGYSNLVLKRVDIHGARVSVLCGDNCDIEDSWLHGQYLQPGSAWHVNGYLSNGGSHVLVEHNTIACEPAINASGGACTAPAASFGDFEPLTDITYDHNFFQVTPGGYCLYAGYNVSKPYGSNPSDIAVTNNVFQRGSGGKCGYYGPFSAFLQANGNVWSGNTWDDGTALNR